MSPISDLRRPRWAAAAAVCLGAAAWWAVPSDAPAPVPAPSVAASPSTTPPPPTVGTRAELPTPYRPPLRRDEVSFAGLPVPERPGGAMSAVDDKRARLRTPPSDAAIAAGEDEKGERREESRRRQEARAEGEDPGERDRSVAPGEVVRQTQDDLDEEVRR